MSKKITFMTQPDVLPKIGFLTRGANYDRLVAEFRNVKGRVPNSVEKAKMAREVGLVRLKYTGVCPACKKESRFFDSPRSLKGLLLMGIKQIGIMALKPIESLKQIFAAHELAIPRFCEECDAAVVVCPLCLAACGRAPVDSTERVVCPNCLATV